METLSNPEGEGDSDQQGDYTNEGIIPMREIPSRGYRSAGHTRRGDSTDLNTDPICEEKKSALADNFTRGYCSQNSKNTNNNSKTLQSRGGPAQPLDDKKARRFYLTPQQLGLFSSCV